MKQVNSTKKKNSARLLKIRQYDKKQQHSNTTEKLYYKIIQLQQESPKLPNKEQRETPIKDIKGLSTWNATSGSWRDDQLSQFFAFNLQISWNHKDNFNFLKNIQTNNPNFRWNYKSPQVAQKSLKKIKEGVISSSYG